MFYKKILIQILRKTYLLPLANIGYFLFDFIKNFKKNRIFIKSNPNKKIPPYFLIYDAYGSTNINWYYNSGRKTAEYIHTLIKKYLPSQNIKLLDWGSGLCRITRHLSSTMDLYASDYNKKSIAWCKSNIRNINFSNNDSYPPLKQPDNYFDCIMALSVFTHLSSDQHHKWIAELYKKLTTNGILIFSTHGKNSIDRLTKNELKRFNNGEIITKGNIQKGKKDFLAYHPTIYIKKLLSNKFEILEYIAGPSFYSTVQDVWIIKKIYNAQ